MSHRERIVQIWAQSYNLLRNSLSVRVESTRIYEELTVCIVRTTDTFKQLTCIYN